MSSVVVAPLCCSNKGVLANRVEGKCRVVALQDSLLQYLEALQDDAARLSRSDLLEDGAGAPVGAAQVEVTGAGDVNAETDLELSLQPSYHLVVV